MVYVFSIVPPLSVNIIESRVPTLQQSYTLTCNINVTLSLQENLSSYLWKKNGEVQSEKSKNFTISHLETSDNNTKYQCQCMATSPYVSTGINVSSAIHQVIIISKLKSLLY